jgi:hypothetical protein
MSQTQTQTQTIQIKTQDGEITVEFLEKYRGKELLMYVYESPSCSKKFSFRAVVRVL